MLSWLCIKCMEPLSLLGSIVGGVQGACTCVILVLYKCIWNAPTVSLVLPAFDNTSSLGSPSYWVVYPPGSLLGDCLLFPYGKQGG